METIEEKIWRTSKQRFKLHSEYKGRNFPVTLFCVKHQIEFTTSGDAAGRDPIRCNCPECSKELKPYNVRSFSWLPFKTVNADKSTTLLFLKRR